MHDQDRNAVLFLHPGPVHRGQSGSPGSRPAPANLRAPQQRTSPAATAPRSRRDNSPAAAPSQRGGRWSAWVGRLLLDLAAVAAPQRVERALAIDALVCVSAEVITLPLNEVGGKLGRADAVVVGE